MDEKELKQKIKDLFIVRETDGSYNLFGKYYIIPENGYYTLQVQDRYDTYRCVFSSLRNAVTWCVFEKNNKFKEVKRIAELDETVSSLEANIQQYKRLVERSKDIESKHIYMAKLFEEKLKKRQFVKELEEFAELSKYWQSKKYEENKVKYS